MDTGGFPLDLVLFGMIAGFLVLRLRSILGRRTGFERPPVQPYQPPGGQPPGGQPPGGQPPGQPPGVPPLGPVIDGHAELLVPVASRPIPEPASPLGQALTRLKTIDRGFDPGSFLQGAEHAFRIIVAAFASGDRGALRNLVADDVFHAFDQAITAREQAGHAQVSEIKEIPSATIEEAELRGTVGQATVKFVSDQISLTKDGTGQPVAGTEAVTEITDVWTFERDLSARDPTWRLVAVRGA